MAASSSNLVLKVKTLHGNTFEVKVATSVSSAARNKLNVAGSTLIVIDGDCRDRWMTSRVQLQRWRGPRRLPVSDSSLKAKCFWTESHFPLTVRSYPLTPSFELSIHRSISYFVMSSDIQNGDALHL